MDRGFIIVLIVFLLLAHVIIGLRTLAVAIVGGLAILGALKLWEMRVRLLRAYRMGYITTKAVREGWEFGEK